MSSLFFWVDYHRYPFSWETTRFFTTSTCVFGIPISQKIVLLPVNAGEIRENIFQKLSQLAIRQK